MAYALATDMDVREANAERIEEADKEGWHDGYDDMAAQLHELNFLGFLVFKPKPGFCDEDEDAYCSVCAQFADQPHMCKDKHHKNT